MIDRSRFEHTSDGVRYHYPANGCAPTGYVPGADALTALASALRIARWGWDNRRWLRDHDPAFPRGPLPEEMTK